MYGVEAAGEARRRTLVELRRELRPRRRRSSRSSANRVSSSNRSIEGLPHLVTARCTRVPAFDSLMPRTEAISALSRPAKNLSAISSRSRGARVARAAPQGEPPLGAFGARLDRRRPRRPAAPAASSGLATTPTELVEGRVAGDAEEPGARLAATGVEVATLAVGALEGGGGHFLGRRPVVHQARDVGVDIVSARAVEAIERHHLRLARCFARLCHRSLTHAPTTAPPPIHHTAMFPTIARPCVLRRGFAVSRADRGKVGTR